MLQSGVGVVLSGYLTYLEKYVVKSWCRWCVTSAVIITVILILSAADYRRVRREAP